MSRDNEKEIRDSRFEIRNFSRAFALYEVLIGVAIFAIGVLAIGRSVENCLNASTLGAEEDRVREILSNRMAEVQTAPGLPDVSEKKKIDTGYGMVTLIQKSVPANLTEPDGARKLTGMVLVTLKAEWERGGVPQSEAIEFYVYRSGLNSAGRRAFTLLEVTLAVVILGMMALVIYRFVQINIVAIRISAETTAADAQYSGLRDLLQRNGRVCPRAKVR